MVCNILNFAKLELEYFLIKLFQHRRFCVSIAKFSIKHKKIYFEEHLETAASVCRLQQQ